LPPDPTPLRQGLANLLTHWLEFEMTRSKSDLASFARDLCADSSLASHVTRGIDSRLPWLRDSVEEGRLGDR